MKLWLTVIAVTLSIWLTHNNYLVKVSKLEKAIMKEKVQVEDLRKELNEKRVEYEKKSDLKKFELEMRDKRNMEASKEVNYFKIKKSQK